MSETESNETKADAYGRYFLNGFRVDVGLKQTALDLARKRLAIAEREYAEGRMVTGNLSGVPSLLDGLIDPPPPMWKYPAHFWSYCSHCEDTMVVCGKCGNNCCNGGHGEMAPGLQCDACPSAYEMQEQGTGKHMTDSKPIDVDPARVAAALHHLDQRAESSECEEMVAEMIAAADASPYTAPTDMQDYWRDAIGETYKPVKWNPRYADHPIRVKEIIAKLKEGQPCPEAADVIVGLVHSLCVSQNIQTALSEHTFALDGSSTPVNADVLTQVFSALEREASSYENKAGNQLRANYIRERLVPLIRTELGMVETE